MRDARCLSCNVLYSESVGIFFTVLETEEDGLLSDGCIQEDAPRGG